jgi:hypothetical protein
VESDEGNGGEAMSGCDIVIFMGICLLVLAGCVVWVIAYRVGYDKGQEDEADQTFSKLDALNSDWCDRVFGEKERK